MGSDNKHKEASSSSISTSSSTPAFIIEEKLIKDILSWQQSYVSARTHPPSYPFITITFAQSINGKIALNNKDNDSKSSTSSNFVISGPESSLFTHALRSIHDGILVGSNTLSIDNPRLTNRLWNPTNQPSISTTRQPRPIVLDTNLQLLPILHSRRVKKLIICCSLEAYNKYKKNEKIIQSTNDIDVLPCRTNAAGVLDLKDVVCRLKTTFDIQSIMVEGGAKILSSFLQSNTTSCVCITISPKILKEETSLPAFPELEQAWMDFSETFVDSKFLSLGCDCIYIAGGNKRKKK